MNLKMHNKPFEMRAAKVRLNKRSSLGMYQPINGLNEPCTFERLFCRMCGGVRFEVDKTADGWCVECVDCGEGASMLTDLLASYP